MIKKGRHISKILGIKIDRTQMDRVLKKVSFWVSSRGKRYIVTPNPEMVMMAQKDNKFKTVLNKADLAIPDGSGLRLADRRLERVTGEKTMNNLIELASQKKWRVFLLGGKNQASEKAAEKLRSKYQGLEIKGFSGPEELGNDKEKENQEMVERINQFKPHLLFVGFGQGKQEKWIADNLSNLKVKVAMGVGGSIDQVIKPWLRVPKVMESLSLGWLWRLVLQPWRIKRQLWLIKFWWLVLRGKN